MPERSVVEVPPDTDAPRAARNAIAILLAAVPGAVADSTRLLVSEFVANSVRHGGLDAEQRIEVSVLVGARRVRVEVDDPGTSLRTGVGETWFLERAGLGFALASQLATRWGIERTDRTSAWFEIDF